jgi:hypothetical protein
MVYLISVLKVPVQSNIVVLRPVTEMDTHTQDVHVGPHSIVMPLVHVSVTVVEVEISASPVVVLHVES